jgi:hypothetical protein
MSDEFPGGDYDNWKTTPPDDWDDDEDDRYESDPGDDEPEEPTPLFGCACENPLSVDTVCAGCIEWMKEQEREAPGATPEREIDDVSTVDQCQRRLRAVTDCPCPKEGNES